MSAAPITSRLVGSTRAPGTWSANRRRAAGSGSHATTSCASTDLGRHPTADQGRRHLTRADTRDCWRLHPSGPAMSQACSAAKLGDNDSHSRGDLRKGGHACKPQCYGNPLSLTMCGPFAEPRHFACRPGWRGPAWGLATRRRPPRLTGVHAELFSGVGQAKWPGRTAALVRHSHPLFARQCAAALCAHFARRVLWQPNSLFQAHRSGTVSRRCWMVLAGLVAMAIASTPAAAGGWSLSKLVPFQKSSASKRAHASVSDEGRSGGLPQMSLPSGGTKSRPPAAAANHQH